MYYDEESVFDDADVDNVPVFSESRRFSRLDSYEKMLLRGLYPLVYPGTSGVFRQVPDGKRIDGNTQTGDKRVGG